MNKNDKQRGNVLFLILIAVALFAALSYAVTQSNRGGGDVDNETKQINASELLQYTTLISNAVQRLKIIKGCADDEISFEANGTYYSYVNPNSPANKSCHIFDPNGGGLSYASPNLLWLDGSKSAELVYGDWSFTTNRIANMGVDLDMELMIVLLWIDKDLCLALNDELGNVNPGGDAPIDGDFILGDQNFHQFRGDYTGLALLAGGLTDYFGCVQPTTTPGGLGSYHFYHVLIPR